MADPVNIQIALYISGVSTFFNAIIAFLMWRSCLLTKQILLNQNRPVLEMNIVKKDKKHVLIAVKNNTFFSANDLSLRFSIFKKMKIDCIKPKSDKIISVPIKFIKNSSVVKIEAKYCNEDITVFKSCHFLEFPAQLRRS